MRPTNRESPPNVSDQSVVFSKAEKFAQNWRDWDSWLSMPRPSIQEMQWDMIHAYIRGYRNAERRQTPPTSAAISVDVGHKAILDHNIKLQADLNAMTLDRDWWKDLAHKFNTATNDRPMPHLGITLTGDSESTIQSKPMDDPSVELGRTVVREALDFRKHCLEKDLGIGVGYAQLGKLAGLQVEIRMTYIKEEANGSTGNEIQEQDHATSEEAPEQLLGKGPAGEREGYA